MSRNFGKPGFSDPGFGNMNMTINSTGGPAGFGKANTGFKNKPAGFGQPPAGFGQHHGNASINMSMGEMPGYGPGFGGI
jgi:hypothetical protein